MNIDEQREAIREGLAMTLADQQGRDFNYLQPNASNLFDEYTQQDFLRYADGVLAFLTEKGAVLKGERLSAVRPEYTLTAPLIEP